MATVNKNGLVAVTALDATTYVPPLKRLYVGGTGTILAVDVNGNAVTFNAFPAAQWVKFHNSPIAVVKTASTATGIVGDTNPEN